MAPKFRIQSEPTNRARNVNRLLPPLSTVPARPLTEDEVSAAVICSSNKLIFVNRRSREQIVIDNIDTFSRDKLRKKLEEVYRANHTTHDNILPFNHDDWDSDFIKTYDPSLTVEQCTTVLEPSTVTVNEDGELRPVDLPGNFRVDEDTLLAPIHLKLHTEAKKR